MNEINKTYNNYVVCMLCVELALCFRGASPIAVADPWERVEGGPATHHQILLYTPARGICMSVVNCTWEIDNLDKCNVKPRRTKTLVTTLKDF